MKESVSPSSRVDGYYEVFFLLVHLLIVAGELDDDGDEMMNSLSLSLSTLVAGRRVLDLLSTVPVEAIIYYF